MVNVVSRRDDTDSREDPGSIVHDLITGTAFEVNWNTIVLLKWEKKHFTFIISIQKKHANGKSETILMTTNTHLIQLLVCLQFVEHWMKILWQILLKHFFGNFCLVRGHLAGIADWCLANTAQSLQIKIDLLSFSPYLRYVRVLRKLKHKYIWGSDGKNLLSTQIHFVSN